MKYTTPENIFETIRTNSYSDGYRNSFLRITGSSSDARIGEVFHPEQGAAMSMTLPIPENNNSLRVVENFDTRKLLGTLIRNDRLPWGVLNTINHFDKLQDSASLDIVESTTRLGFTPSTYDGVEESRDATLHLGPGNQTYVIDWSVDALPFVINPNNDEIIRLDRYYDSESDNQISDGGSGTVPCATTQREAYQFATEGNIKFYLYPRYGVRELATDQVDNFKERPVKTATIYDYTNNGPFPTDEPEISRNWFDHESLLSKYFSENYPLQSDGSEDQSGGLKYPGAGIFLFKLDWGDGSPLEFTDEPTVLESSTLTEHFYEKPGFYTITGLIYRTVSLGDSGDGVAEEHMRLQWERFETTILLNPSKNYNLQLYNYTNFAGVGGLTLNSMVSKKLLSFVGVSPQDTSLNYKFNNEIFDKYNLYDRLMIFDYLYKLNKSIIPQEVVEKYSNYLSPISAESMNVYGCMDINAENYNQLATVDDGSCDYQSDVTLEIEYVDMNGNPQSVSVGYPEENWDTIEWGAEGFEIQLPRPVIVAVNNGAMVVTNTPTNGSLSDIYPSPLIDMFYPVGSSELQSILDPFEPQDSPISTYVYTAGSAFDQVLTINPTDYPYPQDWHFSGWYYDNELVSEAEVFTFRPIDLIQLNPGSEELLPITLQLTYQDVTPPENYEEIVYTNSQSPNQSEHPGDDMSQIYTKLKLWIAETRTGYPNPIDNDSIFTEIFWYPVDPDGQRLEGWTDDLDITMISFGGGENTMVNPNDVNVETEYNSFLDTEYLVMYPSLVYFMTEIDNLNQDLQEQWHYYFPYYTTPNGLRFRFYIQLTDLIGNSQTSLHFSGSEDESEIGFYPDPALAPPKPTGVQPYQANTDEHDFWLFVNFTEADLDDPGLNDGLNYYEIHVWSDVDPETGIQADGTISITNVGNTPDYLYTASLHCVDHLNLPDDGIGVETTLANHILNGELNYYVQVRTFDNSGIPSPWTEAAQILVTTSEANLQGFAEGISQEYPPVGNVIGGGGDPLQFYEVLGDQNRYWAETIIIDPMYESNAITQNFYLSTLITHGYNQSQWQDGTWGWSMYYAYLADYQGGDGEVHVGLLFYREFINGIGYSGGNFPGYNTTPTYHIGQVGQSQNEPDWFECNVGMFLDIIPEWLMENTNVYYFSEINYMFGNNEGSGFARSYLGKLQLYEPTYGCLDNRAENYNMDADTEDNSCGYQDKGHLAIGDSDSNFTYIDADWDDLSEDDPAYPYPITIVPPYDDRNGYHPPSYPYMFREYTGPSLEPIGNTGSNVLPLVPMYDENSNNSGALWGTYRLSDTIYGLNAFVIQNNGALQILKAITSDEDHGLNMANGSFHINHWDILDYFTLTHSQLVQWNGKDIYLGLWVWGADEYIDVVNLGEIIFIPYHEIVTRSVGPHGHSEYTYHDFIEEGSIWTYTAPNLIHYISEDMQIDEMQVFVEWSNITGIQENQYNISDRTITIPLMIDSDNIEFVALYEEYEDPEDDDDEDAPDYYGCTDPSATNWDPDATIDDGSCEYDEDAVYHYVVLHNSPIGGGTAASKIRFPSFANNSNQTWSGLADWGHPPNGAWWTTQDGATLGFPPGLSAPDNVYICIEGDATSVINYWDGWYSTPNFAENSLVTHAADFTFQLGQGEIFEAEVIHLYAKVNSGA